MTDTIQNPPARRVDLTRPLAFLIRPKRVYEEMTSESRATWSMPMIILSVTAIIAVIVAGYLRTQAAMMGEVELPPDWQYWTPDMQSDFMQAQQATQGPAFMDVKEEVRQHYGAIAVQYLQPVMELTAAPASCCGPATDSGCGCGESTEAQIDALYSSAEVAGLPDTVTLASLGCGNPTAIAALKPGETVLDLGSGGGIDCFLSAKAVGPTGHVIGVDMTDSMLALAGQNKAKLGLSNVEFRKGEIEALPVESGTVDAIISNCVINLSPDKDAVFREAFRVLKPGRRLSVSDIVTEGNFSEQLRANVCAWAGCITGAIDQNDYLQKMRAAGFVDVAVGSPAPTSSRAAATP